MLATARAPQVLGQLYRRVQRQAADAKRDLLALPGAIAAGGGACYDPHFEFGVGSVEFQEEVQAALVGGGRGGCLAGACSPLSQPLR